MKITPLKFFLIFAALTALLFAPLACGAADPHSPSGNPEEARGDPDAAAAVPDDREVRLKVDLRVLCYGLYQDPALSSQNPGNRFLELPRYQGDMEFRPDLRLDLETLALSAEPRMRLEYRSWKDGDRQGEARWDDAWLVNEWLARFQLRETVFVSYGRENLQWGPSFLCSPSNPFFADNGRDNPRRETPGMDFGRLVWILAQAWTVSLIANTDEGREKNRADDFKKTYALKTDYSGRDFYGSLILAHRSGDRNTAGFFGGWTLSDAFLLYGEGAVRKGADALYPQEGGSPFGASMAKAHQNDPDLNSILLMGGSYTFENSGTLSVEYAYNGSGYGDAEAGRYYRLRGRAADALNAGGGWSAPARKTLGESADTGLRLLRKNYMMVQYNRNDIRDKLDVTLRWVRSLDDGSDQFIVMAGYALGNHMELFVNGNLNAGHPDTEFGSILDRQWMLGVEYTF